MIRRDDTWRSVLADIGRTRSAQGRAASGRFSIEGLRLHERALRSEVLVESALVSETLADDEDERVRRLLSDLEATDCVLHVVDDDLLRELTEGRDVGAIVGLVHLPEPPDLGRILDDAAGRPLTILVACDVEDPGNVGAMLRTSLAAGAAAFAAVGISDPYHPKAVRTSMGAVFRMPILRHRQAASLVECLRGRSVTTVGAISRGGAEPEGLNPHSSGLAVFIGSEAFGLPEGVRAGMDHLVSIPMSDRVDSFSANAAAAILLYALRRRG
jgi:TrmH family RNA methyltransferase